MTQKHLVNDQIKKLLDYFEQEDKNSFKEHSNKNSFREHFVRDFLQRANYTIELIKSKDYEHFSRYRTLKEFRKETMNHPVLDPNNLLFLSREISDRKNYLQFMPKALFYKLLFDLHFGFAAIFSSSEDTKVCQLLLKGCIWCLDFLIQTEKEDLDLEKDKTTKDQIENLVCGKLIKGIIDLV